MSINQSQVKPMGYFFAAWLIPGMGFFLRKKYLKGVILFAAILSLLCLGIILDGQFFSKQTPFPSILVIFGFLSNLGSGILYFFIKLMGMGQGDITAQVSNYGTLYLAAAGLLNYLAAFKSYDAGFCQATSDKKKIDTGEEVNHA